MGPLVVDEGKIATLNEICALKAASILLKSNFETSNTRHVRGGAGVGPISFPSDYLSELVRFGESLIAGSSSILHFFELPSYHDYNIENDVSWCEINSIKKTINLLALLRSAAKKAQSGARRAE
jgi:hypothetical protein